ncbi:MAG: TRAP transporter small permease [Thermodesulfobacteriota bacterium]|nr:TRAP transporter small permease [Thermodesulfobacteriota bacterium]
MISFLRIHNIVARTAEKINWISAAAVAFIMFLTTADVIMRFFGSPFPGTYEIVGLVGALVISFSLPYTSIKKGHIAVEFLVQRLPQTPMRVINMVNAFIAMFLFGVISWQTALYAGSLMESGVVSPTLEMPLYPFVYGIAIGCALLCVVLFMEFLGALLGRETE